MAVVSLAGYEPKPRYDDQPWTGARLEGSTDQITWTNIETFTISDPDADPAKPQTRSFTSELVDPEISPYLRLVWTDDDGDDDVTDPLQFESKNVILSTVKDVRTRLGRALTDDEEAQAVLLVSSATINIFSSLDRDPEWIPVPKDKPLLSMLCTEIACRAMANPQALAQESERLGSYSRVVRYARDVPGVPSSDLMLTSAEQLMVRNQVFGTNMASMKVRSQADEFADLIWAEFETEFALWYGPVNNPAVWK